MTPTTADKVKEIIESFMGAYYGGRPIEAVLEYFDEWASSPSGSRLVGELVEGWVSVKDRLPEKSGLILISVEPTRDIYVSYYRKDRNVFQVWGAGRDPITDMKTTHWQLLPLPPKIN